MPEEQEAEIKYVKFADTPWDEAKPIGKQGSTAKLTIRLLDYPGVGVFRHWIGDSTIKRPYNCPGYKNGCPACRERNIAKLADTEETGKWRAIHRMDHRDTVNVLEIGETSKLKIFQISNSVKKRLDAIVARGEQFADPTTYDIEVMKSRTGRNTFDVEYDVFAVKDGNHRPLTADEKALLAKKYDLTLEVVPADPQTIAAAMKGLKSGPGPASEELKAEVLRVVKNQSLNLLDVGVTDIDTMTAEKAQAIIKDLG